MCVCENICVCVCVDHPWCRNLWLPLMTTFAQATVLMNHPLSYRSFSTPSVSNSLIKNKVRWMRIRFEKLWRYQTIWSNKLMVTSRKLMELCNHRIWFLSFKISPYIFSKHRAPSLFVHDTLSHEQDYVYHPWYLSNEENISYSDINLSWWGWRFSALCLASLDAHWARSLSARRCRHFFRWWGQGLPARAESKSCTNLSEWSPAKWNQFMSSNMCGGFPAGM